MKNYLFSCFLAIMPLFPPEVLSSCDFVASNKIMCANVEIGDSISELNNFAAAYSLDYIYHLSFASIRFENNEIQKGWLDQSNITFTTLSIEHSDLANIGPQSFSGSPFKNLTYLNIVYTKIGTIRSDIFEDTHLNGLSIDIYNYYEYHPLTFEENCLGELSDSLVLLTIRGYLESDSLLNVTGPNTKLSLLNRLDIGYNNITTLQKDSFVGAPNLTVVYIDASKVQTIESGAFDSIGLQRLDLSRNQLSALPEDIFQNVTGISIYDNLWKCDCNLVWLKDLFISQPAMLTHRQFYCTTSEGEVPYQDVEFCPN